MPSQLLLQKLLFAACHRATAECSQQPRGLPATMILCPPPHQPQKVLGGRGTSPCQSQSESFSENSVMKQRYIQLLLRNVAFLHVTPELQGPSSLPHGPKKPRKLQRREKPRQRREDLQQGETEGDWWSSSWQFWFCPEGQPHPSRTHSTPLEQDCLDD